jgi:DNA topoisomerase-3
VTKTLVVAEKPSVGEDLAEALPGTFRAHQGYLEAEEYIVTWAVGHLVTLAEPDAYDPRYKKWRRADLPILPDEFRLAEADARAGKQLAVIQGLLRRPDVARVINACDAGREGELIFAYIWQTAGVEKPVQRLWISSMTARAIRDGFDRLRPASELRLLEQAARSRAEADWLIGMNATRAATIRGRSALGGVISLGRVQTPTLALLAHREREIQGFVPEDYWLVSATFEATGGPGASDGAPDGAPEGARYEGRWFRGEETRLPSAAEAEAVVARVAGAPGTVTSAERREQSEAPPLLYDLTSLQRDANRRFGFAASRTLRAAQSLYEDKKALTYPRTSSRYLPADLVPQLKPAAGALAPLAPYAGPARYVLDLETLPLRRVVDDARVSDHHAIIPTVEAHAVERFSPDEQRIFDLVARRFLAVFHPPARYARTTVITAVAEETFRTQGRVTLEAGWRAVYGAGPDETGRPQEDEEEERGELPQLAQGQPVSCAEAASEARTTTPPPRYNEATLLSAMETAGRLVEDEALREALKERGLGTPATRAEIIETLIRREYVERHGRDLTPTPKGMQVITLLGSHPLTSADLTGDWEQRLHEMEQGRGDRPAFMEGIVDLTRRTVEQIINLDPGDLRPPRVELGLCPRCGAETGSVIRENRKAYGCTSWKSAAEPGCGFAIWKRVAGRTISAEEARQLLRDGRTDEVLAGFRNKAGRSFRARLLLDAEGRVTFDMPARPGADASPEAAPEAESSPGAPPAPEADGPPAAAAPPRPVAPAAATADAAESRARRRPATASPSVSGPASPSRNGHSPAALDGAPPPAPPLPPPGGDLNPAEYLRQAGLEVVDKRPEGRLWVVDGDPPSAPLAALRERGVRFAFARNGGRATDRRPAWYTI